MAQTVRVDRATHRRPPIAAVFGLFTPLNSQLARFAGSKYVPLWAQLRHEGRRSGRTFSTPVAARRTAHGFVIPLAFGESADWCRNVLASGRAEVRWKDRLYPLEDPVIVDASTELQAFPLFARPLVRLGLFERVMRLRDAAEDVS